MYVVLAGIIVAVGLFVGRTLNAVPLQIVAVWFGTTGLGLTVTTIVNVEPTQLPSAPLLGVTVYVTVCTIFVLFVNVWLILDCPVIWLDSPVTLVLSTTVHVYVVPVGTIVVGALFVGDVVNVQNGVFSDT